MREYVVALIGVLRTPSGGSSLLACVRLSSRAAFELESSERWDDWLISIGHLAVRAWNARLRGAFESDAYACT